MVRTLQAELQKWRRTWFALVTLGAAMASPLLNLAIYASRQEPPTVDSVQKNILMFFLMLTGPLIVTLLGAQMIATEYQLDTWKLSLTAPVPRWSVYLAKWVIGTAWILALSVAAGLAGFPVAALSGATGPMLVGHWLWVYLAGGTGLAALLPAYHLITLLTRSFFVTSGMGIVATLAGVIVLQSKYQLLYPISGNLVLVNRLVGSQISPEVLGSVPLAVWIHVVALATGALLSFLYVQKADYR